MSTGHHKGKAKGRPQSSNARSNDIAVYIAFALIGGFVGFLAHLANFGISWKEILLGYCAALAILINLYALQAYQGRSLANWQQALARLPLRFAGYGRKGAKPLEAAHNSEVAKMAIFISVAVCVIALLGLSMLLIPNFRIW